MSEVEPSVLARDSQGSGRPVAGDDVGAVGVQADRQKAVICSKQESVHELENDAGLGRCCYSGLSKCFVLMRQHLLGLQK